MSAATTSSYFWSLARRSVLTLAGIAAIGLLAVVGLKTDTARKLLPAAWQLTESPSEPAPNTDSHVEPGHSHGDGGHEHGGHDDLNSLEMSEQARKNIGLQFAAVKLGPFVKTMSVPGMVVERPGRSTLVVSAPMTGIITHIAAMEGEAVEPGRKLFDMRLTHEELVQSQAELLQTVEELDVTTAEIKRIERLTENGSVAGKQLLERQYERQKLEAMLRSKREALLLHGLTAPQVDGILSKRQLLKNLTVITPASGNEEPKQPVTGMFQVQSMKVATGQHVNAGDTLVTLADHAELYIRGEAFERDLDAIGRAADANADVSALFESESGRTHAVDHLRILYLAPQVDSNSRTLDFFVTLPNPLQRDTTLPNGHRIIARRYRPGQRVQLQVPIETLSDRLVVPLDAVAQDGAETYVFAPDGNFLDRRAVHVEYRDTQWAVIAHDGSLFPGEVIAMRGAQQLQLALKNKAGGGIDPHAGHQH